MAFGANSTTKEYPQLSFEDASKMVANIFDSCGLEPNTIPLETLASYSEYRRERYSFQKILIIIMLVIFCLLPLCFVIPEVDVVKIGGRTSPAEYYEIRVDTFLPVISVSATVNGEKIPVYETGEHTYSVKPETSGQLRVTAKLINQQFEEKVYNVECIDRNPPELVSKCKTNGLLKLTLDDQGSGIDWKGIFARVGEETVIMPIEYDEETCEVLFKFPDQDTTIYVPDKAGNVLSIKISAEKQH